MSDAHSRYAIVPDETNRVLRVSCVGLLDVPLARTMITEARLSAAEWGFTLLYDVLGVTLSDDIAELFDFPKSLEVYREERTLSIPVALVIPADRDADFWQTYVDAALKAGHIVKTFYAESDAIEWLAEVRDSI